jgi:hypothetical protein
LFVGGDVGGVRCLVPVAEACVAAGIDIGLAANGALLAEWRGDPALLLPLSSPAPPTGTECVVFSSSLTDGFALAVARAAEGAGVPTIHVLDHWSAYQARMTTDGGEVFRPTIYTVIDDLARREAVAAGVDAETVLIVGQPALHDLPMRKDRPISAQPPRVMLVGEPVMRDQGNDSGHPAYRGYTELDAFGWIAEGVAALDAEIDLILLPHPRQSGDEILAAWAKAGRGVPARLAEAARGRDQLASTQGLIGMASMLLYEGWLFGLPVLSVQPNRRGSLLQTIANRQSAWLVERKSELLPAMAAWLGILNQDSPHSTEATVERARHQSAPRNVLAAIESCLKSRRA